VPMLGGTPRELPQRIGLILVPNFSMIAFSAAVETLRLANRTSGRALYQWSLISVDGQPVKASNGIELHPECNREAASGLDTVAVCSGTDVQRFQSKTLVSWLRRMARRNADIGALCTGSYILARAGLLDGYRCTIHWENLTGFQEDYPEIEVTGEIFEIDRNRLTCSGGTASLDLILSLMTIDHGRELATQVAEQFIHERIRDRHDQQRMSLRSRLGISHPRLLKVIELMENNLEEPLARSELARLTGPSTRQLERLFRKYLGRTPTRYYQELRLLRARTLLSQTSLSILDVALACGFVSASHFSKCYREFYARTPREERQVPPPG